MKCICKPCRGNRGRDFVADFVVMIALVTMVASPTFAQYQIKRPVGQQATITISDPSSAVTWEKGKRYTIRWTSEGRVSSVEIVLLDEAGKQHYVVRRTTNSGSYAYTVARTLSDGSYRLRISTPDGKVAAESSGTITIQAATRGRTGTSVTESTRPPSKVYTPGGSTTPTTESGPGEVTTAPEGNQPSGTPTPQQSDLTTSHSRVQQEAKQLTQQVDVSGFTRPDLQIVDLKYAEPLDQVLMHVRNNGLTYVGPVDVKVVALVGLQGSSFTYDETVTLQVELDPGDLDLHAIPGFAWPEPIDHPQLTFGLNVDPQNVIAEQDENNNRLDATVCVPCGMRIDSIQPASYRLTKAHFDQDVLLFGKFGQESHGKVIRLEKGNTATDVLTPYWSDSKVKMRVMSDQHTGTYAVKVYCSDPASGPAYASNAVSLKIKERSDRFTVFLERIGLVTPVLDAGSIAEALADEFGDWMEHCNVPEVDSVRVQRIDNSQSIEVNAWYTSNCPYVITHEIWQGDQLLKIWPLGFDGNNGSQQEQHQVFTALDPGKYQYICRIINSEGEEGTASLDFEHKLVLSPDK